MRRPRSLGRVPPSPTSVRERDGVPWPTMWRERARWRRFRPRRTRSAVPQVTARVAGRIPLFRWFPERRRRLILPYLVVLPLGVALIVVLRFVVF